MFVCVAGFPRGQLAMVRRHERCTRGRGGGFGSGLHIKRRVGTWGRPSWAAASKAFERHLGARLDYIYSHTLWRYTIRWLPLLATYWWVEVEGLHKRSERFNTWGEKWQSTTLPDDPGKRTPNAFNNNVRLVFTEEIQYMLSHLPRAEELSLLVEAGQYDETITMATKSQDCLRTSALWACWLGKSQLLAHLLKLNEFDPNTSDDAGR